MLNKIENVIMLYQIKNSKRIYDLYTYRYIFHTFEKKLLWFISYSRQYTAVLDTF
jgi:hypothetical protein